MINSQLDDAIITLLKQGSLSEYELIKQLQASPFHIFEQAIFSSDLALFQTHFIVHNALYRIRDIGLSNGQFDIDILPTNIRLIALNPSNSNSLAIAVTPELIKLRAYYLDWQNFHQTEESDVFELLDNFWHRFSNLALPTVSKQSLSHALSYFQFSELPDKPTLKQKYKTLSQQYHPDKGGSVNAFQELQLHYKNLLQHIKKSEPQN